MPQVLATAIVVGVIVGLVATWWIGLVAGVLSGVIVAVILPKSASAGLATVFGARPAPEPEFPRYHNLMEGLSISSGSVMPTLQVIDEARIVDELQAALDAGATVRSAADDIAERLGIRRRRAYELALELRG